MKTQLKFNINDIEFEKEIEDAIKAKVVSLARKNADKIIDQIMEIDLNKRIDEKLKIKLASAGRYSWDKNNLEKYVDKAIEDRLIQLINIREEVSEQVKLKIESYTDEQIKKQFKQLITEKVNKIL